MKRIGLPLFLSLLAVVTFYPSTASTQVDKENTLYVELDYGRVVIKLLPDIAPKHVARIKKLAREKFYDGLKFHRVIEGFMAQTGDPQGTGSGGSNEPNLPQEFSKELKFKRGTLGMARTSDPNSANSQFFITFEATPWLDGKYTIFGQVERGMQFVDQIKKGDPRSGRVPDPDIIESMQVASDL
ncbi:MAG: peptidylprolyl isomerase [Methyloligellaceae bacterium]